MPTKVCHTQVILVNQTQALKSGRPNNRKNLKIPVFGGLWVYLVIFEFVTMTLKENLVLFDLYESQFPYIWENLNLVFLIGKNNKLKLSIESCNYCVIQA